MMVAEKSSKTTSMMIRYLQNTISGAFLYCNPISFFERKPLTNLVTTFCIPLRCKIWFNHDHDLGGYHDLVALRSLSCGSFVAAFGAS